MDLHHKEIQAFFDCSVDNLRASPFIIQYILDNVPDFQNGVIIAKSPDATRRASSYAERLQLDIAVIHGEVSYNSPHSCLDKIKHETAFLRYDSVD
eukprot:sb/3479207/